MATTDTYLHGIRDALAPLTDPGRAARMRAYMRDRYPFLGIQAQARRRAVSALRLGRLDPEILFALVEALWTLPEREYRYTGVDLLIRHARHLGAEWLPNMLDLARRDAWWDTVDGLAGAIGDVLRAARRVDPQAQAVMDAILRDDCLWWRRIAMIHQLGWRLETDTTRLFGYARTLAPESDFFIRKGIGWALRDYARSDPEAVRRFLADMGAGLSGLTRAEAGKHLRA
jgi:3-methyladenine DNA glycosylase AlkD